MSSLIYVPCSREDCQRNAGLAMAYINETSSVKDERVASLEEKAHKLGVMLQRLLNKVNVVTCFWRHQDEIVPGAVFELSERQILIENEFRVLIGAREAEHPQTKEQKANFDTLKAWCHWATLNPIDDDQALMAKTINDLFGLLGTRETQLRRVTEERDALAEQSNPKAGQSVCAHNNPNPLTCKKCHE